MGSFNDEIDDILKETLPDEMSLETSPDSEPSFTIAQSVSSQARTDVIDQHVAFLADELDVADGARQMAKSLRDQYRKQRGDLLGTALELVGTSCLYCACKVNEVPLAPDDFVEADDTIVTRRALLRRSKDIATTVGLDPSAFTGASHYVDRYCDELEVSDSVRTRAHDIIDWTEERGLASGKSPTGWAAAAVYNACLDTNTDITQDEVAELSHSSTVTIRNRYQEQREALRGIEDVPSDPDEILDHVFSLVEASEDVRETAHDLIEQARAQNVRIDERPEAWSIAAIRRASELQDGAIGWLTLSQFTDEPSDELKRRTKALRQLRHGNLPDWAIVGATTGTDEDDAEHEIAYPDLSPEQQQIVETLAEVAANTGGSLRLKEIYAYSDLSKSQIESHFDSIQTAREVTERTHLKNA